MITFTVFSDKGGRDINEDAIGHAEKGNAHCFVLCDGLGGHGLGDVASKIVTDSVLEGFVSCRENDLKKIKKLFDDAQKDLLKEQEKRFAKMRKGCFANFCERKNRISFVLFSFFRKFAP